MSRLSEFGSLNTAAQHSSVNDDEGAFENDEELDSLDEGLHAFHEDSFDPAIAHNGHDHSILPTHDGLGTFPGSSFPVQEHLWHFERLNPQRRSFGHQRRRSSLQRRINALEADDEMQIEKERMSRIDRWRTEHSRILLEEVERATRKNPSLRQELHKGVLPDTALQRNTGKNSSRPSAPGRSHLSNPGTDAGYAEDDENLWYRIVRVIVRDLVGIDETTLAMIFGEALLGDEAQFRRNTSPGRTHLSSQDMVHWSSSKSSLMFLETVSRGLIASLRRVAQSPAAVGSPINPLNLDYAGMPIARPYIARSAAPLAGQPEQVEVNAESTPTPHFAPTLDERPQSVTSDFGHAALWGIEEEPAESLSTTHDREYWEQTPSIKTIFRLLHQHFTARRRPLLTLGTFSSGKPSNVATISTSDSVRRAAVIRQHHPLISCQIRRSSANNLLSHAHRHHGSYTNTLWSESSLASVNGCKSKRGSGSSRNYWDLRGSIGSGSMGGMGVWGEV